MGKYHVIVAKSHSMTLVTYQSHMVTSHKMSHVTVTTCDEIDT